MSFASYKDRNAVAVVLKAVSTAVGAEAAEAALAEVEDRNLAAKYPVPAPNRRRAWIEGIPLLDDPPERRKPIHTATAIEVQTSKLRRAVRTQGHFPSDEAAAKSIYLAKTTASQEWTRSVRQWQVVKSQRAIIFEDRFPMVPSKRQRTEFRTVSNSMACTNASTRRGDTPPLQASWMTATGAFSEVLAGLRKAGCIVALARLRYFQVQRAQTGIESALSIPVAPRRAVCPFVLSGADQPFAIGFHDRLRNRLGNAAKKIAAVLRGQNIGKVHVGFGHRGFPVVAVDVSQTPPKRTPRWSPGITPLRAQKLHHALGH